ncbi:MAG: hypothetical protein ACRDNA_03375 [Gaiellaceae bacterium]
MDARFSGYRNDEWELWISPSEVDRHVYLVHGSAVERWPRAWPWIACE